MKYIVSLRQMAWVTVDVEGKTLWEDGADV